jgi:hypothetical protein
MRTEGEGKMKKRIVQPWTPEDNDRLRRLAAEGRTSVTIAERMKRTPASVRGRANAINVVFIKTKGVTRRPIKLAPSERMHALKDLVLPVEIGLKAKLK